MNYYTTYDGNRIQYLISQNYTHLHIVVRRSNMLYDKGSLFVYGTMNGVPYVGVISYNGKYGSFELKTITGDGFSYAYGGLESNGTIIRMVFNVRQYSTYVIQGTDPFEYAHTTG